MKTVCVLISTYNGEKYILEQIDSVIKQDNCSVKICVRDDGSSDNTIDILEKLQKNGLVNYYQGPNSGPARSFMDLLIHAPIADYYAFCDQDDIWEKDKLSRAIYMIDNNKDKNNIVLYYSDLKPMKDNVIISDHLLNKKMSSDYQTIITMCNFIFGCTIVMTRESKNLLTLSLPKFSSPMHDWWCAGLISLYGTIVPDEKACIQYRQHECNVVGANLELKKKMSSRLNRLIGNNDINFVNISSFANELLDFQHNTGLFLPEKKNSFIELVANYSHSLASKLKLIFSINVFFDGIKSGCFRIVLILLGKI